MIESIIREATIDDLPAVLALYHQLNPDDPALDHAAAETAWSALLASGLTIPFVADVEGLLLSTCTLAIVPNMSRGARPYGVIENVVTHIDHRRTGLGRAVLHAALDTGWRAKCYKVLLATGSRKASTLRFYERVGFKRDGKTYFEIRRQ